MIFSNKSQMIHVISEVVVLIGFTFYFTSKLNKLSNELIKTNQVIKSQNSRINYLENIVKHILNKVNKPVKVEPYQNTSEIKEIKEIQTEISHNSIPKPHIEIQNSQENLNEEEMEERLNNTLEETFDTIEKTTQQEENTNSSEEDLDKELEAELEELKEEEKLE